MTKNHRHQLEQSKKMLFEALDILFNITAYSDPGNFGPQWHNLTLLADMADQFGSDANQYFDAILEDDKS